MLTPAEAEAAITAALPRLAVEPCALERAAGRVLRETVAADRDQPPFDRVAMDGIALSFAAHAAGRRAYTVGGTVAAGARPLPLPAPDHCLEVMTGAVLPAGTDVVVPVEEVIQSGGVATLAAGARVEPYINVHRQGTDARAGDLVLAAGVRLRAPEIAIAASAGRTTLQVSAPARIAVISTGDELVPPDKSPEPWQVRRSNAYGIAAALRTHGHGCVSDHHVRDDRAALHEALAGILDTHDVLVLSGGVSAGRFDFVPDTLTALGVRRVFHKIAQRPGKPMWFGVRADGRAVFALPGNPVSTLICLQRYVLPALDRMAGTTAPAPLGVPIGAGWPAPGNGLTHFIPVASPVTPGAPGLELRRTHGSGDFTSLAGTLGFVELTAGVAGEPGSVAPLYTW